MLLEDWSRICITMTFVLYMKTQSMGQWLDIKALKTTRKNNIVMLQNT